MKWKIVVCHLRAGLLPSPAFGYYCASKFGTPEDTSQRLGGDPLSSPAHEGAVSTLAAEIDLDWDIKVRLLPPFTATVNLTLGRRSLFSNMVPSARRSHPQDR